MSDAQEVIEHVRHLTKLDICQSTFSFYSDEPQGYDTSFQEECGYFVPRELRGYVRLDSLQNENARRTVHEVSHGIYLENMPIGQTIVSDDRVIAEFEKHLFGRLLRRAEKLLVLTDKGIVGVYSLYELDRKLRRLLPEGINQSEYENVAFLNGQDFRDYRNLRDRYSAVVSQNITDHEGFCTLMEERILSEYDPEFAEQLFWSYITADSVYGVGFRRLKAIESRYGLDGVIDYLEKRNFQNPREQSSLRI